MKHQELILTRVGFIAIFCGLIAFSISLSSYELVLMPEQKNSNYFYRSLSEEGLKRIVFIGQLLAYGAIGLGILPLFNKKTRILVPVAIGLGIASFWIEFTVALLIIVVIALLLFCFFLSFKSKN